MCLSKLTVTQTKLRLNGVQLVMAVIVLIAIILSLAIQNNSLVKGKQMTPLQKKKRSDLYKASRMTVTLLLAPGLMILPAMSVCHRLVFAFTLG